MTSSALGYDTPAPQPVVEEAPLVVEEKKTRFQIESIREAEDGGLDMTVNLDYDSLMHFAKIGIMKVLEDAANRAIAEHGQA